MASFVKLALFASLRNMRSTTLGRNLKALILRFLLLWPRILRSLRKVWSWYFQTSFSDEMKTEGDNGEPSMGTLRKRKEYAVVCASRDSGDVGGPSRYSISGSSYAEQSIPLEIVIQQTPSVPHSLSFSYAPRPQGSPRLSAAPIPLGSPHTPSSSLRAESPRLPPVHGRTPSLSTRHQFPSTESMNPRLVPLHSRGHNLMMYRMPTGAHQSTEIFQPEDSMSVQSFQAPFGLQITSPELSVHRSSTPPSMANASNHPFRPDTYPVRPMHPDQVSRYVKKGDV
jgi:hypothetical protein